MNKIFQEKKQFIVLSQKNFDHNVEQIKSKTSKKIIAVVKANAYGHGLIEISKFADSNNHIDMIATHSLSEALELRNIGIKKKILVLAHIDDDLRLAKINNISVVIFNLEQLKLAIKEKVNFHLKFNTGLNRLGFNPKDTSTIINILLTEKINPEGLFSHFAESDSQILDYTKKQIKLFDQIVDEFAKMNIEFQYKHLTNSTGFLRSIDSINANALRTCGSILGLKKVLFSKEFEINLLPVLSWYSPIIQINDVGSGEFIGYGRTYCTKKPTKVAVIATGYADGYPLTLTNCGYVGFHGQLFPILGKICMNMIIIDVTCSDNLQVGDFVELVSEKISLETLSSLIKQPVYFIACGINSKIPKTNYLESWIDYHTTKNQLTLQ